MRIIGGKLKGLRFQAPDKLPVRPTTDMAKESLFNILAHQYHLSNCDVLDLFSGTGNIAAEFASRGAKKVVAVEQNFHCVKWIEEMNQKYDLNIKIQKTDVFFYLKTNKNTYDLIFADPPYQLATIPKIAELVFEHQLLNDNGCLIIEHQSLQKLDYLPNFKECRKYGNSSFSIFQPLNS